MKRQENMAIFKNISKIYFQYLKFEVCVYLVMPFQM